MRWFPDIERERVWLGGYKLALRADSLFWGGELKMEGEGVSVLFNSVDMMTVFTLEWTVGELDRTGRRRCVEGARECVCIFVYIFFSVRCRLSQLMLLGIGGL